MADLSHRQVSHDRIVLTDFEMAHAQFVFFVLERPFHRPAGEGDMQHGFDRRPRGGVREKVFFLTRAHQVASVDEPVRAANLAIALNPDGGAFEFPDHRPLFGVLEMNPLPGLVAQGGRLSAEFRDWSEDRPRFAGMAGPGAKIVANFDDVALPACFESGQELGTTSIPFVGGEPAEGEAVGQGAVHLSQGDVVLGSVDEMFGNARLLAAHRIIPTVLGQEQIAIKHRAEAGVIARIAQVNADDAVVFFAGVAAPLHLNARRLVAGLGMAGIVDDADGLEVAMIAGDNLLDAIAQQGMIPLGPIEELLQSSTRRAGEVGNGLDALARQVGELTTNVVGQVPAWFRPSKTVVKLVQKIGEFGRQGTDLFSCHP